MLGSTVLNYRVIDQLGQGGLGIVYRAEHTLIGRKAALKVLNPEVASDEAMVQRFLAEARAVAAIRHPNIVDVTDYGHAGGQYVIVMELLEGETLGQRLARVGHLDERTTLSLLAQLASAVGAAHEVGIVHRDLKPENIFLTAFPDYPDFVKVLDFGIAKLLVEGRARSPTSPGMILGTPAYMSPEQCMASPQLDHRSDIYSLGVVAFRMLTGQLPFTGSPAQLIGAHLTATAPLVDTVRPGIAPGVVELVARCLRPEPAQRWESMKALRAAIHGLGARPTFADEDEAEPPPPPPVEAPGPTVARLALAAPGPSPQARPTLAARRDEERAEQEQAIAVAARLKQVIAARLASNTLRLPSLPEVAVKCLQKAHHPDTTFSALATELERDPFIASRVLRNANSPLYGGLARVTTLDGAVARLGLKHLVALLQELAAEQVFTSGDPAIRNAFRGIWEHCLGVGHLARDISVFLKAPSPDTAYLAGLFHDIGKPVVASLLLEVERSARSTWLASGVWRRVVEECHRDVGAVIAMRWYLPRAVAVAVAELDWYDMRRGRGSTANIVRLANAICQRDGIDIKQSSVHHVRPIISQGGRVLGIDAARVEQLAAGLAARVHALTHTGQPPAEESTRFFDRTGA